MFAVDGERPREANRNLGDACKMLDVASGDVWIEGVVGDVV